MNVIRVKVSACGEHPDLAGFPMMAPDAAEVLRQSVHEHGLLEPLKVAREKGARGDAENAEKYLVVDGRNRLAALKALGIEDAPAMEVEADPVEYAIQTAVARRQLTKSGVVLLLFERHPELVERRGQKGNPTGANGRKCHSMAFPPEKGPEDHTFQRLAEKFQVPRDYFRLLAEIQAECTPEQWQMVRERILFQEVSIPRMHAGIGGLKAGVDECGKRKPVKHDEVFGRATTSMENTWKLWGKLGMRERVKVVERFRGALLSEDTPEEIRWACVEAMRTWPDGLRAKAMAELKRGGK